MQQAQFRHFIGHSRPADGNLLAWYSASNVPQHGAPTAAGKGREAFFSLLDVLSQVMLAIATFCLTGGISRVVVVAIGV